MSSSFFHGQSSELETVTILHVFESVTDRTEIYAVVDNNIQVSFKAIAFQLSIHLPLVMECAIGLIAGGALQTQLLFETKTGFSSKETVLLPIAH